jgi:excinuclease ABC subunit C
MTHQIGRCTAPCVGLISTEDYGRRIQSAVQFLKGRDKKVLRELEKQMKVLASEERFEEAARLRDGIQGLNGALEKQIVVNDTKNLDQDVVSYFGDERGTLIETLHIRGGRVLGSRPHFIGHLNVNDPVEDPRDWLASFLNQYYESNVVPDEVILPVSLGDDINKLLGAVLEERTAHPVRIRASTDHKSHKLMEMAEANAQDHFRLAVEKSDKKREGLADIQRKFGLSKAPLRIEGYDISHFQGAETVASQVVFEEGVPAKDHYRLYKIRGATEGDDYKAMMEVLSRRLKHAEYDDPDLILIDGGKGQLNTAVRVLQELQRADIPVASIAKARTQGNFDDAAVSGTEERFFLPGRAYPVIFHSNPEAFRILVSLRDEAHRFAISYHRKLRENSSLQGALDGIHGVGEILKKRLLEKFETVEALRNANVDELCQVEGGGRPLAEKILLELGQVQ